jgi:predicted nucleic acid-binding protein
MDDADPGRRRHVTEFFADTHAILAFLSGDEAAARRFRSSPFRTGLLNLLAAHYAQLAAEVAPEEAARNLAPFEPAALAPDPPLLREAARLLHDERRGGRRLSLVDAVGYAHARRLGVAFVTGEPVFRGLAGVEFLGETGRRR